MTFGYARVSSADQNPGRQEAALCEAGCEVVYTDKASGKDFDRPMWQTLYSRLRAGDLLIVKSIDRLGRSYRDILDTWREMMRRGVAVAVLDMPLLDTRGTKDLTGTLISDIVLQLLSYVAQTEREYIRQRQAEGIALAKQRGVHLGRRPMTRPEGTREVLASFRRGSVSSRAAAAQLGVSSTTVLRWAKEATE